MDVLIINQENKEVVAEYPVSLQGLNYAPSEEEYFNLAWDAAVEDGVVDSEKRSGYEFKLRG